MDNDETIEGRDSVAIVPRREQEVEFYGDAIPVAQTVEGSLFVAIRPLTDFLELEFSAQRRRVMRDEILVEAAMTVIMTGADGRQRKMMCIPLELLPGWLFGITASRAAERFGVGFGRMHAGCRAVEPRIGGSALRNGQVKTVPFGLEEGVGEIGGCGAHQLKATHHQHHNTYNRSCPLRLSYSVTFRISSILWLACVG